jgi:hypothetical protein
MQLLFQNDLFTEVSYQNGILVDFGIKDSIRADVVLGSREQPIAVFDLKSGSATLTLARIQQIRANLPVGYKNIPIIEVKP